MNTLLKNETLSNLITATNSSFTILKSSGIRSQVNGYALALNVTVNTPAAGVFTAAPATDLLTLAAHDFTTGLKVRVSSATTLPAPLAAATDYFVVVISSSTFKLATTLANAIATVPVVIDITDAGTGAHTVTPSAIAGATYKIQASTDTVNWVDVAAATAITATAGILYEKLDPMYDNVRVTYDITAGRMSVQQNLSIKGV